LLIFVARSPTSILFFQLDLSCYQLSKYDISQASEAINEMRVFFAKEAKTD